MAEISLDDQIKCVGREIGLRKNVYPKFLKSGRITQAEADLEISRMEAVYATLKALKEQVVAGNAAQGCPINHEEPRC